MANSLLKRLLGEAAFAAGPDGTGRYVQGGHETVMPSSNLDLSGIASALGGPEEKREVQIARRILAALDNLNTASTSGGLVADIRQAAEELLQMHGQS